MNNDILIINDKQICIHDDIDCNIQFDLSVGTIKYKIPLELEVVKDSETDLKIQDFLNNQYLYDVKIEINRKYNER